MLENIKEKLKGSKTYLACLAGIIGAIVAWQNGAITTDKMIEIIWEAIVACFLRAGVAKAQL